MLQKREKSGAFYHNSSLAIQNLQGCVNIFVWRSVTNFSVHGSVAKTCQKETGAAGGSSQKQRQGNIDTSHRCNKNSSPWIHTVGLPWRSPRDLCQVAASSCFSFSLRSGLRSLETNFSSLSQLADSGGKVSPSTPSHAGLGQTKRANTWESFPQRAGRVFVEATSAQWEEGWIGRMISPAANAAMCNRGRPADSSELTAKQDSTGVSLNVIDWSCRNPIVSKHFRYLFINHP